MHFVFWSNLVPDTAHKPDLSWVKPREVCLSTFHNLLCAPVLSAVVLSYHIFTQSPLQLWQFWNAAFVRSTWKERMRGTRPQRIAAPSALMQALSICCGKHVTHAKEALGPARATLKVTCSCVWVHACILYLIGDYTTAPLCGVTSKNKSEVGSRWIKPPVGTSWFKAPLPSNWINAQAAVNSEWCAGFPPGNLLFSTCTTCHQAFQLLHNCSSGVWVERS